MHASYIPIFPGPSDIIDGNWKLSLGLLWTLVRHYQIRSSGKGLSTKEALLSWVNALIPEKNVTNFTSDWNDGIALCSLIDRIEPGLCPQHASLRPLDGLENCTLGMEIAQKSLDIPQIMEPARLNHPSVDEMSVMTYVSYFCAPVIKKLLAWVQSKIPQQNVSNFKTDWNNGINLAALLDAVCPGLFPDWSSLDPNDSVGNLTKAMDLAQDQLEVVPVLKPKEMADPSVDELNVVTYISRFLNTKAIPFPDQCSAFGPGLTKAIIGKETAFQVDGTRAGTGNLAIEIRSSSGSSVDASISEDSTRKNFYKVLFVPTKCGETTITIKWGGTGITGSPFTCSVAGAGSVSISGPEITGGQSGRVGKAVTMTAKGIHDINDLSVCINRGSMGEAEQADVTAKGSGEAEASYVPTKPGRDKVTVKIGDEEISGSPFIVRVIDPSQCHLSHCDPPVGEAGVVGKLAKFRITGDDASLDEIVAEAETQSGLVPVTLTPDGDGFIASYSPMEAGTHSIIVKCGGESISGSPLSLSVVDPVEEETSPKLDEEETINVSSAKDGGVGELEASPSNPSSLATPLEKTGDEIPSSVEVCNATASSEAIEEPEVTEEPEAIEEPDVIEEPETFASQASKCVAMGQVVESGSCLHIKEQVQILVDTGAAGSGALTATGKQPDGQTQNISITEDERKMKHLSFEPSKVGTYSIFVEWEGEPIPGSPFQVNVVDPSRCVLKGEPLETVQVSQSNALTLDTTGAGPGTLSVLIDGGAKSPHLSADIALLDDNKCNVNLIGKSVGDVSVDVKWGGYPIPKSPFIISVCDKSACVLDSSGLEQKSLQVGVPFHFKVNSTGGGNAKLQVMPEEIPGTQYTIDIRSEDNIHEVTCTPWTVGEQTLGIMWGQEHIPDSPLTFSVCDPRKCRITGLPDPDHYVPLRGEPIEFTIDYSLAGPGEPTFIVRLPDESEEEQEGEEDEEDECKLKYSYVPEEVGALQFLLEFNGISLLQTPWISEVPDPNIFKVVTPKGMFKLGEPAKFYVTGVTKQTRDFSVSVSHPDCTVETNKEENRYNENIFAVEFTPTVVGEYSVQVQHASNDIEGSPFTASVTNPDGVKVLSSLPDNPKVGEMLSFKIDASECGPGDLSCHLIPISGEIDIEPQILSSPDDDDEQYEVSFTSEVVTNCRLELRVAGYLIEPATKSLSFVDPSNIIITCKDFETRELISQGDPLCFDIDGRKGGRGIPEVNVSLNGEPLAVTLAEKRDGTYTARMTPWQPGDYQVTVNWSGYPVPKAPAHFIVHKVIDSHSITAQGIGLKDAIAEQEVTIVINAYEVGLVTNGILVAKCFDPEAKESNEVSPTWVDNNDGTYDLTLTYPYSGKFVLCIDHNDQPIYQSPFTVNVKGKPNANKCRVFGPSVERLRQGVATPVTQQIEIHVDSSDAGSGELMYTATDPTGEQVTVMSHKEEVNGHQLQYLRLGPFDVGEYTVRLYWSRVELPDSPLHFKIVDPALCLISGLPLSNGMAQLGDTVPFSISPGNCGISRPAVAITTLSDNKPVEDECLSQKEKDGGIYEYKFTTSEPDNYSISVTVGGLHTPGSPFKCDIVDPMQYTICGLSTAGKYAYVGDTVSFNIQGFPPEGESFSVVSHGPHNDQVCVVRGSDGFYNCSFPVIDPGSHEVYVECANKHVPGSPFQINVADPSKCTVLEAPTELQVGTKESIVVKTSDAGEGELTVLVNGEKSATIMSFEIDNTNVSTYIVTLFPHLIGTAKLDILWGGRMIPQFPLNLNIYNAKQCKVFGQSLVAKKGKVGEPITFTVLTRNAGTSKLTIKASGPSAQYTITPDVIGENKFEAQFTPWQVGQHTIEILWGKAQVPKSPFSLHIDKGSGGDGTCHASGDGLKRAIATKPSKFMLFSTESGLVEKGALKVAVQSALHGETVNVQVKDENNGSYEVVYLAPNRGAYFASVSYYDKPIPGSPFKINCVPGPEPSKCRIEGLHQNTLNIAGKPIEFRVDSSEAGTGVLKVFVQGPRDHVPKVYLADDGKGHHSVKFDALYPGRYFIVVAWSDSHIPGSPFKIRVHPGPDASKVKVSGPGIEDSYLGEDSEINIDTKEAGIGTLLIKVHGIKDAFKIEANPVSEMEKRVLIASYSPSVPGSYDIFIRWSGTHVPGSPFKVQVKKKPGEEGSSDEEAAAAKKAKREKAQGGPQKRKVSRKETDKEIRVEEQKARAGRVKKISTVTEVEYKRSTARGQARPKVVRALSSSAIPVGPIQPQMKMKKNPSMSASKH